MQHDDCMHEVSVCGDHGWMCKLFQDSVGTLHVERRQHVGPTAGLVSKSRIGYIFDSLWNADSVFFGGTALLYLP